MNIHDHDGGLPEEMWTTKLMPLLDLFDVLGRRWALRVVWELCAGPATFRGLLERAAPISSSVLTDRLRELRAAGIVDHERSVGYSPHGTWARRRRTNRRHVPLVEAAARLAACELVVRLPNDEADQPLSRTVPGCLAPQRHIGQSALLPGAASGRLQRRTQQRNRVVLDGIETVSVVVFAFIERAENRIGALRHRFGLPPAGVAHPRPPHVCNLVCVAVAQSSLEEGFGYGDHESIRGLQERRTRLPLELLDQRSDALPSDGSPDDRLHDGQCCTLGTYRTAARRYLADFAGDRITTTRRAGGRGTASS
jgi:hypothetical protein